MTLARKRLGRFLSVGACALGATLLLAGCGSTVNGAVIGSRSTGGVDAATNNIADTSSLDARLKAALAAAQSVQAVSTGASHNAIEMPVDSTLSLRQFERLTALQGLGATQISSDLAAISKLQGELGANPRLSSSEKSALGGMLSSAAADLQAAQAGLSGASAPDMARAQLLAQKNLRVQGFVDPQVHLSMTATQLLDLLPIYMQAEQNLADALNRRAASGQAMGNSAQLLADMQQRLQTMNSIAHSALDTLASLSASGYPGNQSQLVNVKNQLQSAETAANAAGNDAVNIRTVLAS